MKKSLILLVILLMSSLAMAAEDNNTREESSYFKLSDFAEEPMQAVRIMKHDKLEFEMFNQTHILYIKELINDNIKVVFYPNKVKGQSSKGAGSLPLKKGRAIAIDVNMDGMNDITLHLYDMTENDAVLIIRDVRDIPRVEEGQETQVPDVLPSGEVVKGDENNRKNSFWVLGLIVFGLFGVLMIRKKMNSGSKESASSSEVKENVQEAEKDSQVSTSQENKSEENPQTNDDKPVEDNKDF
jgi:hypothetical protein